MPHARRNPDDRRHGRAAFTAIAALLAASATLVASAATASAAAAATASPARATASPARATAGPAQASPARATADRPALAARIGRAPALPRHAKVLGALPATAALHVDVVLQPRDPAALAAFASQVSDPSSPLYRNYLPAGAFADRFGPTPAALSAVEQSLRAGGLDPGRVSADHLSISVTASAGVLAKAFSTSFERVQVGARVAFANTSSPLFPGAVKGYVQGVIGLDDVFLPHKASVAMARPAGARTERHAAPHVATGGPQPCSGASSTASYYGAYTADQVASAYNFSSLYQAGDEGAGVGVGIFELEPYSPSDVSAYQSCYGTSTQVGNAYVDGGAGSGYGSGEAALDIEDVIGLAPRASIEVYQAPDTSTGAYDNYAAMIGGDSVNVISTSWGLCEPEQAVSAAAAENTLFEEAAAQGQSVFAAAGDFGSEGCYDPNTGANYDLIDVADPASQPYVTGVGGTYTPSLGSLSSTQWVWNDSYGGGGGGISSIWGMPSYQSTASASLNVVNVYSSGGPCGSGGYCRQTPDVSADASPSTGMPVYYGGGWTVLGGTSVGAPFWAALTALVDADPACSGNAVGFANPALYKAASSSYSNTFYDVTLGNNDYTYYYSGYYYPAGTGYDMASGLGTPNAGGLAAQMCDRAPNAPAGVTATPGPNGTPGDGEINLSWSAPANNGAPITGYTVTPSPPCPGCGGLTTAATFTTVTGLAPGTSYTFFVTAQNAIGSSPAGTSNAQTAPATAPSAPAGVVAGPGPNGTPGDGEIDLSWGSATQNGASITAYTVTPSPPCPACGGLVTGGTFTTVTGLVPGGVYTFSVTARNSVGTGPAGGSNAEAAPATVPGAPVGVVASQGPLGPPGDGEIDLSWTAASPNGSPITGYTITASPSCPLCSGLSVAGLLTTVTGLVPGTTYNFSVAARNGVGTGPAGMSGPVAPGSPPAAPASVTATPGPNGTPGDGEIDLSWLAPADNGTPITGYTITPSPSCGECGGLSPAGTATTVTGLVPGAVYSFDVVAKNASGAGPAGVSNAEPAPATAPGTPAGVTASPGPAGPPGDGEVDLSWMPPASDNGSQITSYTVTPIPACPGCGGLTTTGTSTTVTGLVPDRDYQFTVAAENAVGRGQAAVSNHVLPNATAPGAPLGVTAKPGFGGVPGDGQVFLSWTGPPSNGSQIMHYTITPTPACPRCGGGFTETHTYMTVTGLSPGVSYTFDVTATNSIGTGPAGVSKPFAVYTVPGAPRITGVRLSLQGTVQLTFGAPAVTGGFPVTGYVVTATPSCPACTGNTTSATSTTMSGFSPGTVYRFAVTARTKAGMSPPSAYSGPVRVTVQVGYWLAARDGAVFGFGSSSALGGPKAGGSNPVVGITSSPDGKGYFVATANGTVNAYGDVRFYGDLPQQRINRTDIVAIVATIDGKGYWLVGADGEVYIFGDAPFHGSLLGLKKPVHVSNIIGMVACAGDAGYLLVGSDGGVFAFGATHYYGSLPGIHVKVNDIRGILPSPTDKGYILVGADGGAFVFGTGVRYYGSLPGKGISVHDIVGIALTPDGGGYYMAGTNGAVFGFGDAVVYPTPKALLANLPVAAIAGV